MSRAARATLCVSVLLSSLTVWFVHHQQNQEREVRAFTISFLLSFLCFRENMYQGVLRDDERRREKLRQREEELWKSRQKRALYERVQTVDSVKESEGSRHPLVREC